MVCWSLWNRRNNWVWNRVNGSAFGVNSAAISLLSEWRRARGLDSSRKSPLNCVQSIGWIKPPGEWIKINIDAALCWDNCIGIGAVIRDSSGQFIRARCCRLDGSWQPREAEALALRNALSWVQTLQYDYCIFESDSKLLVEACKGVDGASYFHTIVLDCIDLCKHFNHVIVQDVRRSANGVAHLLAIHSMSDLREWVDAPPDFIYHVLNSDNYE